MWNITFSWYQSLTTVPKELREASHIFRLNWWMRLKTLELPFGLPGLLWNSMMSWAGGWFFLMAAEIFTVGERDFRLAGLGSYLQAAAKLGDIKAIFWGLETLIAVILLLKCSVAPRWETSKRSHCGSPIIGAGILGGGATDGFVSRLGTLWRAAGL